MIVYKKYVFFLIYEFINKLKQTNRNNLQIEIKINSIGRLRYIYKIMTEFKK